MRDVRAPLFFLVAVVVALMAIPGVVGVQVQQMRLAFPGYDPPDGQIRPL